MPYNEALAERVRRMLAGQPGLTEKKMFGGVAFMLEGHMACAVMRDDLVVRVGPQREASLLPQPHARPFEHAGRPMKGWLMIAREGYQGDDDLAYWVAHGVEFARALPPKDI